jgi:hypothetical protein
MSEVPTPKPIEVVVCDVCGEDWVPHLRSANRRMRLALTEDQPRLHVSEATRITLGEVTLLDCVQALKNANLGPVGPIGPKGEKGE